MILPFPPVHPAVLSALRTWFARQSFHHFLNDPATGPTLDALIEDNRQTDLAIEAEREERDDRDDRAGSTCSAASCGNCGRCS